MSKWVSIEERLPQHHTFCWVVTGGLIDRGTYYAHGGGTWMDDDSGPFEAVTHWQEIVEPALPKELLTSHSQAPT